MDPIQVNTRTTKTKGELNALRMNGNVPGIIYGGKDKNQKVSISKKIIKVLLNKDNFLSNILKINIEGSPQDVLPREIKFDTITDEPIHIDFLRVIKGTTVILEIPVKFSERTGFLL